MNTDKAVGKYFLSQKHVLANCYQNPCVCISRGADLDAAIISVEANEIIL